MWIFITEIHKLWDLQQIKYPYTPGLEKTPETTETTELKGNSKEFIWHFKNK